MTGGFIAIPLLMLVIGSDETGNLSSTVCTTLTLPLTHAIVLHMRNTKNHKPEPLPRPAGNLLYLPPIYEFSRLGISEYISRFGVIDRSSDTAVFRGLPESWWNWRKNQPVTEYTATILLSDDHTNNDYISWLYDNITDVWSRSLTWNPEPNRHMTYKFAKQVDHALFVLTWS